ncbi:MAG: bifunctional DNA-formamidopyrimidine glycosylase/DNA-(apurinic or apyrimidinic site) lyase [Gemmatimonadales bacterium]
MPELPEVETMVRDLVPLLVGRTIRGARVIRPDVLDGVSARTLTTGLTGATVTTLERRAKNAVIVTDRKRLVVQPGMTGALFVKRKLDAADERYAVLRVELEGGETLVYHDVRRFGTIRWLDPSGWSRFSAEFGPEPLDEAFTPTVLAAILASSRAAVKKVLMDQKQLAGVGNIYANEALFYAGVDPSKPADQVPDDRVAPLHGHLVRILEDAVAAQGSTIRDYRTGTGESGNFQGSLAVYDRAGQPCRQCGTPLAGTHAIDGRSTVFCYRCQT